MLFRTDDTLTGRARAVSIYNDSNHELTCIGGQCGCAEGTKCGNRCVDTETDAQHCGACDDPCDDGKTCVGGQCDPAGCGPGQRGCGGGRSIPDGDLACCNQDDCGGSSGTDLRCRNDRCECSQSEIVGADWGVCFRVSNGAGRCAPCCPGGDFDLGERCAGPDSEFVCVSRTADGCGCPEAAPVMCTAFGRTKCSADTNCDPSVCGLQFCQDCGPTGLCCGGQCVGGCPQGTGGSCASGPCNSDCSPCPQGSTCCNFGTGSQCYEGMGTTCFP